MRGKKSIFGFVIAVLLCSIATSATSAVASAVNASPLVNNGNNSPADTMTAVEQAQNFSNVTMSIIEDFLINKLPAKALVEGEAIRADTQKQLEYCESLATSKEEIWRYKTCSSSALSNALAALTALMDRSYGAYGSGAARLSAFW